MDTSTSRMLTEEPDPSTVAGAPAKLDDQTVERTASNVEEPWWRSSEPDGIVTGLSADLADRLGFDPLWVRLGFIVLALLGGIGLFVYAGLWLSLIVARDGERRWARPVGAATIVAVPLLISGATIDFWTGPLALIFVLGGLAFALWRPAPVGPPLRQGRSASDGVPDPAVGFVLDDEVGTDADRAVGSDVGQERRTSRAGVGRRSRVRPTRPPRESSVLGRMTLGLAVITAAAGALIDQLDDGRMHPEQWLGAAAVVCGLGLLVGTFRGSARWLVVPAICLGVAGYGGGVLERSGIAVGDALGDSYVFVGQETSGRQRAATGFGSAEVYVGNRPGQQATVDVNVGIGDIYVNYSDDTTVEVRNDFGDIGVWSDGTRQTANVFTVGPEGAPDVIINASMQKGRMLISSFPAYEETTGDGFVPEFDEQGDVYFGDDVSEEQRDATIDLVVTRNGATGITEVADGVKVTDQGWLILGNNSAVLDDANTVILGNAFYEEENTTLIETDYGPYRIVGTILITPQGDVFDLDTIRAAARAEIASQTEPVVPSVPSVSIAGPTSTGEQPVPTVLPSTLPGEG